MSVCGMGPANCRVGATAQYAKLLSIPDMLALTGGHFEA